LSQGLVRGAKIVADEWVIDCLREGKVVSEERYLVQSTTKDMVLEGPARARADIQENVGLEHFAASVKHRVRVEAQYSAVRIQLRVSSKLLLRIQ
jgi:hypothetical protein